MGEAITYYAALALAIPTLALALVGVANAIDTAIEYFYPWEHHNVD